MNKTKKNLFIALAIMIVFTAFSVTAIATTNKCFWETDNPNIETGYTPTLGYVNSEKELNTTPVEGFRYYPIRDMVNVRKVLLHNELVSWVANGNLDAWTVKVVSANRTGSQYKEDVSRFNEIGCDLPEMKSYGYSKKDLTDAQKWARFVKWFEENYECHTECHTWNFCAFGSCSENRFCLPKCTKISGGD